MALGGETSFEEAMKNTKTIKVDSVKQKYINTRFKRISAKMYDYHCDVKLSVGDEKFRAHKHILQEASDYFDAMFSHDMKEKEQRTIELHDIGPQGFSAMMDYFYHGHVTLNPNNTEEVIEAARFFHIEWLVHICCDYLIHFLSLENYDVVLMLADKYCLGDLNAKIIAFISKNFISLVNNNQFFKLSYELLNELMALDHYIDASETVILNAVLKWIDFNPDERKQHARSILSLIRYHLLEPDCLECLPEEVTCVDGIDKMIEEAKVYQSNPPAQCLSTNVDVRGAQQVLCLYALSTEHQLLHYKVPSLPGYFSETIDTSFMHSMFEFAGMAVLGNFLFVAGGYARRNMCSSPSFYCYNPRNRSWAELSSMSHPRVSFQLVAASRGLYAVMGVEHLVEEGHDQENVLKSVEYYDPISNMWENIPELPVGSFSVGAVVLDDNLYVSGGITEDPEDNIPTNYVYKYSPKDQTWSTLPNMLVERHTHAMVAHKNKLFVFGGYTSGPSAMQFDVCHQNEVFDVETNQWSLIAGISASLGRIHPSVTVMDDTIYLLSGNESHRFLHFYNADKDEMEKSEPCGEYVLKLASLIVAIPSYLL